MAGHVLDVSHLVHPSRLNPKGPYPIHPMKPVGGKQAMVTPTVKDFASQFKLTDDLSSVKKVIRAVKCFELKKVSYEDMQRLYAQRTAGDIIYSKTAITMSKEDRDRYHNVQGCVDYGLALTATLRALGLKASFWRLGDRTLVNFKHGGKEYVVDPSRHTRKPEPVELNEFARKFFDSEAEKGRLGKGKDAWDIRITDLHHYGDYSDINART